MRVLSCLVALAITSLSQAARAEAPTFSGDWILDLRTPVERQRNLECGIAEFNLTQQDNRIIGSHSMATVGCGRQNEGGEKTVTGIVINETAVLVVTSGRNGAVVMGTATLQGGALHWRTLEAIRAGEPEGDSPLILGKGVLTRKRP
jgi:hypothetical protein